MGEGALDRTGGRGELPVAQEVFTPESLVQREREHDKAYIAMMLWAMSHPDHRSNRLIAKSMGINEANVRSWKKKFGWEVRCSRVPNAEYVCLELYRRRMDEHVGTEHADMMRAAMDVVVDIAGFASLRSDIRKQRVGKPSRLDERSTIDENGAPTPPTNNLWETPLSENELERVDPARYMADLAYKVRDNHLQEKDIRKQVILIDAVLGLIAQRVKTGDLKVAVRDIPSLLRARALLTGLPTENVAIRQHVSQDIDHKHTHVVESVRMQQAKKSGDQGVFLNAMQEEVNELQVILQNVPPDILPAHAIASEGGTDE